MRKINSELKNLMNLIMRYTHQSSTNEDISMHHAVIIRFLIKNENKPIYIKDIQKAFVMRKSTCSRMLTLMETNGLITRVDDPVDSRKKSIHLTDKSKEIYTTISQKFEQMEIEMVQSISQTDLEIFYKVLDQIKTNITEDKDKNNND